MLAPSVVRPPWARNSACKQQGDAGDDDRRPGADQQRPKPVPQGCEQVPATGTGTGMQEMTKTAEPTRATRVT